MVSTVYRPGFRRGDPPAGRRAWIVNGLRWAARSSAITGRPASCRCRRPSRRPPPSRSLP